MPEAESTFSYWVTYVRSGSNEVRGYLAQLDQPLRNESDLDEVRVSISSTATAHSVHILDFVLKHAPEPEAEPLVISTPSGKWCITCGSSVYMRPDGRPQSH